MVASVLDGFRELFKCSCCSVVDSTLIKTLEGNDEAIFSNNYELESEIRLWLFVDLEEVFDEKGCTVENWLKFNVLTWFEQFDLILQLLGTKLRQNLLYLLRAKIFKLNSFNNNQKKNCYQRVRLEKIETL